MPYIQKTDRWYRWDIEDANSYPRTAGELNYLLTLILHQYYKDGGNYQAINDILGALEGAKLEFYRRIAAPYEDQKCFDNGDVYI